MEIPCDPTVAAQEAEGFLRFGVHVHVFGVQQSRSKTDFLTQGMNSRELDGERLFENKPVQHVNNDFAQSAGSNENTLNELKKHQPTFDIEVRLKHIKLISASNRLGAKLVEIESILAEKLMHLDYGEKVTHVYNPVDYAYKPHVEYYRKYCLDTAQIILVGMNPGPFGMAQSGVPFGDVQSVSDWLGIKEAVSSPNKTHQKRPILGFNSKRAEVSGSKMYGFLKEKFGSPCNFFQHCFIYNHCPLVFMDSAGRNITPGEMPVKVKKQINLLCDEALAESVKLFPKCTTLVGIGRFPEERIKFVCKKNSLNYKVSYLMHPSPRNPSAAKGWAEQTTTFFEQLGVLTPSTSDE